AKVYWASDMKVHLTTLGCPKNQVDSELMLGMLTEAGFPLTTEPEEAECLIVNTCAFIDRAREESVNTILELARLKATGRCRALIVTGCLTQRYGGEVMDAMPEVDAILGTSGLERIVDLVRQASTRHDWATSAPPGYLYDATTPRLLTAKVPYAYVKIAEGCDMGCTFCAIPQSRPARAARGRWDFEINATRRHHRAHDGGRRRVPRRDPRTHRPHDGAGRLSGRVGGRVPAPPRVPRHGALRPARGLHLLARGGNPVARVPRPRARRGGRRARGDRPGPARPDRVGGEREARGDGHGRARRRRERGSGVRVR